MSESFALEKFLGAILVHKRGHDIKLNGLRMEIKGARPHINNGYLFHLHRYQNRWGNIFVLVCFDKYYCVDRLYLVPQEVLKGKKHIWIGKSDPVAEYML